MSNKSQKKSRAVFRNRNYRLLVLANIINRFGDSVDAIVFTWLTYTLTESAAFSALVFAANRLPTVLLQPLTGVWMERRPKRRAMVVTDLLRGLLVGYILLRLATGLPTAAELLIFTLLISTVEAFRQPAGGAILPQIVPPEQYTEAVSYQSGLSSAAELVGTGLGAVLIGLIGNAGAMAVDVVTFLLSALLLSAMGLKEALPAEPERFSARKLFRELGDGVSMVKGNRAMVYLILLSIVLNGLLTPYNSLEAAMTREILHSGAGVLSVVGVTLSLGMIAGASLFPTLSRRVPVRALLLTGSALLGAMYLGTVAVGRWAATTLAVYLSIGALMLLVGFGVALLNNFASVLILQKCDRTYLSRLSGLMGSLSGASMPAVSLLVSILTGFISTELFFIGSGVFVLLSCGVLFSRRVMPAEFQEDPKSKEGGVPA